MEDVSTNVFKSVSKKRGCFIVRDRCIQFIDILKRHGISREVPLEEAKELFMQNIGVSDRKSLAAYFGSQAHTSIRRIQKIAQYGTGTMSFKTVELAQEVSAKKGYFEILGLARVELRGSTWFFVLTGEPLVPELFPQREGVGLESMRDFSLSSKGLARYGLGEERLSEKISVEAERSEIETTTHTTYRVGERNLVRARFPNPTVTPYVNSEVSLCTEEEAVLNARPLGSDQPDRGKIKWCATAFLATVAYPLSL